MRNLYLNVEKDVFVDEATSRKSETLVKNVLIYSQLILETMDILD